MSSSPPGFNGRTRLDRAGHPHSENLRVTERFRRVDFGHMQFQITNDDPETLTKPLSFSLAVNYAADTDMLGRSSKIRRTVEFREGSQAVRGPMGKTQTVSVINGKVYLNALPLIPQSETKFESTGATADSSLTPAAG